MKKLCPVKAFFRNGDTINPAMTSSEQNESTNQTHFPVFHLCNFKISFFRVDYSLRDDCFNQQSTDGINEYEQIFTESNFV